jgi:hypothetical protein
MIKKISLISNTNTLDKTYIKKNPLSMAFYYMGIHLERNGFYLDYVNEDKNRVYFKLKNLITKKESYIMDLSLKELKHMNMFLISDLINNFWEC